MTVEFKTPEEKDRFFTEARAKKGVVLGVAFAHATSVAQTDFFDKEALKRDTAMILGCELLGHWQFKSVLKEPVPAETVLKSKRFSRDFEEAVQRGLQIKESRPPADIVGRVDPETEPVSGSNLGHVETLDGIAGRIRPPLPSENLLKPPQPPIKARPIENRLDAALRFTVRRQAERAQEEKSKQVHRAVAQELGLLPPAA